MAGDDEVLLADDQVTQPVSIGGEPKEVVLLLQVLGRDRRVLRTATVDQILFTVEVVAVRTVVASIGRLVDVAVRDNATVELL